MDDGDSLQLAQGQLEVIGPGGAVGLLQHSGVYSDQQFFHLASVQVVEEGVLTALHLCPGGQAEEQGAFRPGMKFFR